MIGSLLKLEAPSFVMRRDRASRVLALGHSDGRLSLLGEGLETRHCIQVEENAVVTNLRWRPAGLGRGRVLLAVTSEGLISHYHAESGRLLISQKEDNSIMALDYSPSGRAFATAGRDFTVRVYDEGTKSLALQFPGGRLGSRGHGNRVFATRFVDEQVLLSGGWDSVLHVWDLRSGQSERCIFGPHLSGDALDISQGQVLTGSHRDKEQVQLLDLGSGQVAKTISYSTPRSVPYVYSAMFYKGDILVGSSGHNALRIFGREQDYAPINEVEMGGGCYSIDGWEGTIGYVNSAADLGLIRCSK
jgi:COMPASS component SWD3